MKKSKCTFGQTLVKYLGHILTVEGVQVDDNEIKVMQEGPVPRNITELRGFLGLTGYYRKFVKNYGLIARPLTDMTKKGGFKWNEQGQQAFELLKEAMKTTPVLAMPNFELPLEVHTDASNFGIGAILV